MNLMERHKYMNPKFSENVMSLMDIVTSANLNQIPQ
jgi:hypothetical protein